ncbi:glycosyltransferase family 2 protein [Mucilaginibacter sp. UR6-11]|uniref:glycosyltransferase family 2 protein n=1 Tax=Mucilaginibacter sp. UR6-11 TaxID=1435644 RepID=UPI001E602ABC|nr:glycosyltransferase family 2 protein [Mucilaginibacter sp. UR6-11]MCC8425724.1 glycosyltransferase [Mucilaginibacter sp. UR6-11]
MANISFFIPAYNCAKTIAESIESIIAGNLNNGDELIVVNDCSTDDTAEVLLALKQQHPFINIFTHKRNKGGAAARNTAVENAANDLLFCLDADNVLAPDSVDPLKEYLISMNADVASFQYQHFFSADKLKPDYIWSLPEGVFDLEFYYNGGNTPGQHGNYLFTKQSWVKALGYAEGSGALDTWTFGLRQAMTGAVTVVLKDTYYYHRLDYEGSYWMRDAEADLWSVSVKATYALYPFFDRIDEKYLNYMLGKGRYNWFYNRTGKPLKLVSKGSKDIFYKDLHQKVVKFIYPKANFLKRGTDKIKRILNYGGR